MMNKDLYDKFPDWSKTKQKGNYLIGTDDIDSQATISLLHNLFGYEQNGYITRSSGYKIDTSILGDRHISVDLACLRGRKTYDNHLTLLHKDSKANENSANINVVERISNDNYTEKYAGSTLLQVMSLFDVQLPKTDDGKLFLLSIDSTHLGHYNSKFKKVNNKWLELLGYTELIDIMNKYKKEDIDEFWKVSKRKLEMKNDILTIDDELRCLSEKYLGYEIILPKEKFTKIGKFTSKYTDTNGLGGVLVNPYLYSLAFTFRNQVSYTLCN